MTPDGCAIGENGRQGQKNRRLANPSRGPVRPATNGIDGAIDRDVNDRRSHNGVIEECQLGGATFLA